jgi:hypothetical protein
MKIFAGDNNAKIIAIPLFRLLSLHFLRDLVTKNYNRKKYNRKNDITKLISRKQCKKFFNKK